MLEVQALRDAAQLDVEIAADELERDFFAGVADGEIDFAESAPADAALDRVAGSSGRAAAGIQKLAARRRASPDPSCGGACGRHGGFHDGAVLARRSSQSCPVFRGWRPLAMPTRVPRGATGRIFYHGYLPE